MTLPYQKVTTTADKALGEIRNILNGFGCDKICFGEDRTQGIVFVQFEHKGRMVNLPASMKGYAAAWLQENPYTNHKRCTRQAYDQKALSIASVAVYSMLRDWVKAQVTIVESGLMSFEGAFLGQLMLPSGKTVLDEVKGQQLLRLE